MKCPACEAEGKKSSIQMAGGGTITDMCGHYFYDEDGVRHSHDPNRLCESGKCSNGHSLIVIHGNKCPHCDFGSEITVKF